MNKKLLALVSFGAVSLPLVALAFDPGTTPNSVTLNVQQIIDIVLNFIWPIFGGFSVIMFLVAAFAFLTSQGDPGKVQAARMAVLWAIVGVVVGLIAFSIPLIVRVTLGNGI